MNALRELRPLTYDEFISEHVLVSAAERDLQIAIQAALDIGGGPKARLSIHTGALGDFERFARYVSDWLQTRAAQD